MELSKCPLCGGTAGRTRTETGLYRCYCTECGTRGPIAALSIMADEMWNEGCYERGSVPLSLGEVSTCPWCNYDPFIGECVAGKMIVCSGCGASTEAMLNDDDLLETWNGRKKECDDEFMPCPMCGGKPDFLDEQGGVPRVKCSECGLVILAGNKNYALRVWNTRPTYTLSPCPLCRSNHVLIFCNIRKGADIYYASCCNCNLSTEFFSTKDEAAAVWNMREGVDESWMS